MIVQTTSGVPMNISVLGVYLRSLVDRFFKILPIWENEEDALAKASLTTYMKSLQSELLGCKELIVAIREDAGFMSLLSILQYLIDHPECSLVVVKREVFRAISICNKLKAKYAVAVDVETEAIG